MEELKIIGSHQTESKHFNTIDEFNIYYVKHKTEMTNMTTQKLNKMFTIDGYRITKVGTRDADGKRVNGEICLKPASKLSHEVPPTSLVSKIDNDDNQTKPWQDDIEDIMAKMKVLTDTVNRIIEHLNASS